MSALMLLLAMAAPQDVVLEPTDDVWVYQFAQDQTEDAYLRVWGGEEGAVGKSADGFSYSCLKFALPPSLPGQKLKSAKLVLLHGAEPNWDPENAKKNPVEVRALSSEWEEENWQFDMGAKVRPQAGDGAVLGTGFSPPNGDQPFKVEVDLMGEKGGFLAVFEAAQGSSNRQLGLALTSKLQPDGEGSTYRFYSRNNDAEKRPKLVLTFGAN